MVSQTRPDPAPLSDSAGTDDAVIATTTPTPNPAEIGGRDGPDPTRYGDWEKNGRCIDF